MTDLNDETKPYSIDEYKVLIRFFGTKLNLLNYLITKNKIIRVEVKGDSDSNILTSSNIRFGRYIVPLISTGGFSGKKLKRTRTPKRYHRKNRVTRKNGLSGLGSY